MLNYSLLYSAFQSAWSYLYTSTLFIMSTNTLQQIYTILGILLFTVVLYVFAKFVIWVKKQYNAVDQTRQEISNILAVETTKIKSDINSEFQEFQRLFMERITLLDSKLTYAAGRSMQQVDDTSVHVIAAAASIKDAAAELAINSRDQNYDVKDAKDIVLVNIRNMESKISHATQVVEEQAIAANVSAELLTRQVDIQTQLTANHLQDCAAKTATQVIIDSGDLKNKVVGTIKKHLTIGTAIFAAGTIITVGAQIVSLMKIIENLSKKNQLVVEGNTPKTVKPFYSMGLLCAAGYGVASSGIPSAFKEMSTYISGAKLVNAAVQLKAWYDGDDDKEDVFDLKLAMQSAEDNLKKYNFEWILYLNNVKDLFTKRRKLLGDRQLDQENKYDAKFIMGDEENYCDDEHDECLTYNCECQCIVCTVVLDVKNDLRPELHVAECPCFFCADGNKMMHQHDLHFNLSQLSVYLHKNFDNVQYTGPGKFLSIIKELSEEVKDPTLYDKFKEYVAAVKMATQEPINRKYYYAFGVLVVFGTVLYATKKYYPKAIELIKEANWKKAAKSSYAKGMTQTQMTQIANDENEPAHRIKEDDYNKTMRAALSRGYIIYSDLQGFNTLKAGAPVKFKYKNYAGKVMEQTLTSFDQYATLCNELPSSGPKKIGFSWFAEVDRHTDNVELCEDINEYIQRKIEIPHFMGAANAKPTNWVVEHGDEVGLIDYVIKNPYHADAHAAKLNADVMKNRLFPHNRISNNEKILLEIKPTDKHDHKDNNNAITYLQTDNNVPIGNKVDKLSYVKAVQGPVLSGGKKTGPILVPVKQYKAGQVVPVAEGIYQKGGRWVRKFDDSSVSPPSSPKLEGNITATKPREMCKTTLLGRYCGGQSKAARDNGRPCLMLHDEERFTCKNDYCSMPEDLLDKNQFYWRQRCKFAHGGKVQTATLSAMNAMLEKRKDDLSNDFKLQTKEAMITANTQAWEGLTEAIEASGYLTSGDGKKLGNTFIYKRVLTICKHLIPEERGQIYSNVWPINLNFYQAGILKTFTLMENNDDYYKVFDNVNKCPGSDDLFKFILPVDLAVNPVAMIGTPSKNAEDVLNVSFTMGQNTRYPVQSTGKLVKTDEEVFNWATYNSDFGTCGSAIYVVRDGVMFLDGIHHGTNGECTKNCYFKMTPAIKTWLKVIPTKN